MPLFASFERAHGGRAPPSKTVILSNQLPQVIHTDTPLLTIKPAVDTLKYSTFLLYSPQITYAQRLSPRAACGDIGTSGAFLSCHPHTDIYAGFRLRIRGEPNIALLQQPPLVKLITPGVQVLGDRNSEWLRAIKLAYNCIRCA